MYDEQGRFTDSFLRATDSHAFLRQSVERANERVDALESRLDNARDMGCVAAAVVVAAAVAWLVMKLYRANAAR